MNKPDKVASEDAQKRPVFVSYATADRKEALSVCKAVEDRGVKCWISCRDVEPGENYQEAIVAAVETVRAMVLVFSEAANNSDEIKKELSLASRYHVAVIALRIEDVEPSKAFAYELSTRQWIDAFEGWDHSIDTLIRKLESVCGSEAGFAAPSVSHRRARVDSAALHWAIACSFAVLVIFAAVGAWRWMSSTLPRAPSVGFSGFEAIGAGVTPAFTQSLNQEIRTGFGGAEIPLKEHGADFVLHGSVEQRADGMQLTASIDDARNSETLWSRSDRLDERQGLTLHFYSILLAGTLECVTDRLSRDRRPANAVLSTFIQACYLDNDNSLTGELMDAGRQMAKAAPRFTGGWWAIAAGADTTATLVRPSFGADSSRLDEKTREEGAAAARQLISLSPDDADGYRLLATLLPVTDSVEKDRLFRESISKRPENCGCGYEDFGDFLLQSGRINEALTTYQRGLDQGQESALGQWRVAMAEYLLGESQAASAIIQELDKSDGGPFVAERKRPLVAMWNGRWKDAFGHVKVLNSDDQKAIDEALEALASGNQQRINAASEKLEQVPVRLETEFQIIPLLASLGRNDAAFRALNLSVQRHGFYAAPGTVPGFSNPLIFDPRFQSLWNDPRFAIYLQKAGFIAYWKATRSRPDACATTAAPSFCKLI